MIGPRDLPLPPKLPPQPPLHGVLPVNKPTGWTSRDVVNRVGRLLGDRSLGHAGTLDPDASGLLLLVLGDAARLVRWLQDHPKTYRTTITLGAATSTDDAAGQVIATAAVPNLSAGQVQALLDSWLGTQAQVPPQVSALQRDGVRDHERVRRGEVVQRPPRPVQLYAAQVRAVGPASIELELTVGSGFYVRSLARDLGVALGTLGHVQTLHRSAASGWDETEALALTDLEAWPLAERRAAVRDVRSAALRVLPELPVSAEVALQLQQGKRPALTERPRPDTTGPLWLACCDGAPVAIVDVVDDAWHVVRGFPVGGVGTARCP